MQKELEPGHAIKTYRYLRIGMLGAVVLLTAAIIIEAIKAPDCWQTSISAYYYTPVRALFVGSLVAIGLALIVIKGPWLEDLSLNVAGMLAPVVAIVPTSGMGSCWSIEPDPEPLVGPKGNEVLADWVVRNIENNFYALAIVGVAGLVVAVVLAVRDRRAQQAADTTDKNMRISAAITALLLLVGVLLMVVWDDFKEAAHYGAAISMFVALNVAVIAKARARSEEPSRGYLSWYRALGWLMPFGLVVWGVVALVFKVDHHVFIIEAWEIAVFFVFWVVQTRDNWQEDPCPEGAADAVTTMAA